ncbi:CPBP family intramembrane glutamic endopeptidase [Sinomonas terrae]|uniref:CPBP family intramembrane metalloprotease n=1 Tax=Sinomonas terrae TaxID=2908838 RepID=A0ABS9U553_9MICC|nr:CPBP family intramembrane glutamic endopeptidase [Sinomonas terrae]MCH6471819.1 CPBP family intramembrane metalloprotease [Sinomonas terrae]
MDTITPLRVPRLAWATLGLVAAVVCGWAIEAIPPAQVNPTLLGAVAFLGVWIPLLAALTLCFAKQRLSETLAFLGLRFQPLDALWGLGIGCLGRAFDAFLRMVLTGSGGLVLQPTLSALASPVVQTIVLGILAPVVIAPVIEEIYFRGLIQRSLAAALEPLGRAPRWAAAVVLTSLAFALVHALLLIGTPNEAMLTGISTFIFALLAGTTAAATNRLGGSIAGHIVFNGLGVLLTWPV